MVITVVLMQLEHKWPFYGSCGLFGRPLGASGGDLVAFWELSGVSGLPPGPSKVW